MTRRAVFRILPHTYRGKRGWLIVGRMRPGDWPSRVFTETRESAEHIRAKLRVGKRIELEDFKHENT